MGRVHWNEHPLPRSFIEAYQPEYFYVVNETELAERTIGKTRIFFIRPEQVGAASRNPEFEPTQVQREF